MSRHVQAIDWEGGLSDAWSTTIEWVPRLLLFAIILLVGWFIAKAVSKLVATLLERVGFDRVSERSGLNRFFSGQFGLSDLIAKLLYYVILLVTLQIALSVFGPNAISDLVNDIVAWLPRLVIAILIVVIAAAIANAVREILSGVLSGLSYGNLLSRIAAVFIIALGIIAALNQIGIGTAVTLPVLITVLATIGGILVVGVGGGLVSPMRRRWESWLGQIERDAATAKQHRDREEGATAETTASFTQGGYGEPGSHAEPRGYPSEHGSSDPRGYPPSSGPPRV